MISKEIYEKVTELTRTDYDFKLCGDKYDSDYDTIETLIDDLLRVIEDLEEEKKEIIQDIEENYRPIPYAEQIGYNERDFY